MHRHHPDVEVLNPTLRIWVEESQMLEKGIGLFLGVHVVLMLSRSVGAAESRLSPVLRCDLVLSTEFATASINLRGNIVWPTCSSTAFVEDTAWSSTRLTSLEVWPHQLLAQTQPSSHGIKKRPFLTYVEMCFYHIILECPYEGVSFVFADKFTNILTILLDKCTTIDFCTMQ